MTIGSAHSASVPPDCSSVHVSFKRALFHLALHPVALFSLYQIGFIMSIYIADKSTVQDNAKTIDALRANTAGINDESGDIDPKEERAFVWRLDLGLLVIGFLGYMFKYIDQTNIVREFG